MPPPIHASPPERVAPDRDPDRGRIELDPCRRHAIWFYLFLTIAALQLIPIWAVRYFPSQDGPAHVDSAAVIQRYIAHTDPLVRHYYLFNQRLVPNWICHATMASLMTFLPPLAAERIILSLYVLLLPAGVYYLLTAIRRDSAFLAMLALPLVYNFLFQMGFYNFSIGVAICLLTIGYWLRCRDDFTYRHSLVLAVLAILLYLSHLFCLLIAGGLIFLLAWLAPGTALTSECASPDSAWRHQRWRVLRRRWIGTFFGFVPALMLIVAVSVMPRLTGKISKPDGASLAAVSGLAPSLPSAAPPQATVDYSPRLPPALAGNLPDMIDVGLPGTFRHLRIDLMIAHGRPESIAASAMFWIFLAIVALLLARKLVCWRWNAADIWLLIALAVGLLTIIDFLHIPAFYGLYISQRLELFFLLLLLPWLAAQKFRRPARWVIAACAGLIALAMVAVHVTQYRRLNADIEEFMSAAPYIEPRCTLLPLCFAASGLTPDGKPESLRVKYLGGSAAGGYLSAERELLNLSNYEADRDHFPILFRPELNPFDYIFHSDDIDFAGYQQHTDARVDYVLLWDFREASPTLATRITRQLAGYEKIYTSPQGHEQLYRRRISGDDRRR